MRRKNTIFFVRKFKLERFRYGVINLISFNGAPFVFPLSQTFYLRYIHCIKLKKKVIPSCSGGSPIAKYTCPCVTLGGKNNQYRCQCFMEKKFHWNRIHTHSLHNSHGNASFIFFSQLHRNTHTYKSSQRKNHFSLQSRCFDYDAFNSTYDRKPLFI